MRLLALALLATACSVTPRALRDDERTKPPSAPLAVDWEKAGDEAVDVLAGYLRVDTVNPPGNETAGAMFLSSLLAKDGIESEIVEFAPGRGSLIARLKGTGSEKPFCMLSHIDVVSSEAQHWPAGKGPLSGAVDADGMLWGRGALDMKGLGALEAMTLVWLKRLGIPLKRDVILIAVADEELNNEGMKQIVRDHWSRLDCGHLINEGGMGITDLLFKGQTVYPISVAEKGVLWVRMVASGPAGHGSTPIPGRAPERLLKALAKVTARDPEPVYDPSIYTLLREVGIARGGATGYVLSRPFLVRQLVEGDLMENPATRAVLTNTCQPTGFAGQLEPNVIPSEVSATLDCRLLPGVKADDLLAELRALVDDPQVRFDVLQWDPANASPWDDPVFASLARAVQDGRTDVAVGPVLSPGFTDSLYARPLGVVAYGFVPFEITKEEAATMHGHGERVSTVNVRRGLRILVTAVAEIAGAR